MLAIDHSKVDDENDLTIVFLDYRDVSFQSVLLENSSVVLGENSFTFCEKRQVENEFE